MYGKITTAVTAEALFLTTLMCWCLYCWKLYTMIHHLALRVINL